ncbi:MAG: phenylalanine--tRNA ligase beta subunit-related protein [Bacteroidales bacterium]|nr:phenylalanine--tRNA ligase beta subunit-related protein [Bacteroidales bacterium]
MAIFPDPDSHIHIRKEISSLFPNIVIGYLLGNVENGPANQELRDLINIRSLDISGTLDEEGIRQVEGISLGKKAYRQLGKDPNRYRLSAEALMRRIVKGKELYSISSVVDSLNLVSLCTGVTIGGFDLDLVEGNIELGIGQLGEKFVAIGRGPLNIENLPVYRDCRGAIGSPTSDCERTQITLTTQRTLMLITGFYGETGIGETLEQLKLSLSRFCLLSEDQTGIIRITQ